MTLWDFHKAMRHALGVALVRLRERVPGQAADLMTVDRMVEIRDLVAAELQGARVTLEEMRLQAFARTLAEVGCSDSLLAAELNEIYRSRRRESTKLYPDVTAVLDALRPRYVLGLLSNGNTSPEQCGLSGSFSFVVFAQNVGAEKPAPEIFEIACLRAGCRPEELIHVGDSLACDVQGANAAGAMSVWLNRDGGPNTTRIAPDYEIRSLTGLLSLLRSEV